MRIRLKIEYDKEADGLYVHLTEKQKKVSQSREIEDGIILDFEKSRVRI